MPKPRYSIAAIVHMYVHENMSHRRIALLMGICNRTVQLALRRAGVESRSRTCERKCWCGADVEKRWNTNGKGRVLSGTLCRQHRLHHQNHLQQLRRSKKKAVR